MNFIPFNEEVLFTKDPITTVSRNEINKLKKMAESNERRRIRLCTHMDIVDKVHEMVIIHKKHNYIRPHKHIGKSESFHIIEGALELVVFDELGNVDQSILLGEYDSSYPFYWRLSESRFHTVIPKSEIVVFHETTSGPFHLQDTIYAEWSPKEAEHISKIRSYLDQISGENDPIIVEN